jgi:hypothetical protein
MENISQNQQVLLSMCLTIVNIIQILLRVSWIIYDQSSTQAITILVPEVAVIPECPLEAM